MPSHNSNILVALIALLMFSLFASETVRAHATGENYVFLNFRDSSIDGYFEFSQEDLKDKIGVDLDLEADGYAEAIDNSASTVNAYIAKNFAVMAPEGEPYTLKFTKQERGTQNKYVKYFFECETGELPDKIAFRHEMCFEDDTLHRGLLLVRFNSKTGKDYGEEYTALVFSPDNAEQELDLNNIPSLMFPRHMIWQGVLHIWIGLDHILFLLALMLPVVLVRNRKEKTFSPATNFKSVLWRLLKIITVFTVAHSITLALAALGYLNVPSRLVESIIALSIILVAANNCAGTIKGGSLLIIFILGLFHGLGFATVMGHLPFRMGDLRNTIIAFNIGVELGQVAIVAVLFPVLFTLRKSDRYVPVILRGGSIILAIIASLWLVERAFDLDLNLPF